MHYGLNSLTYLVPRLWELLPDYLKRLESIDVFNPKIKTWIPENCPCRTCKSYQVDFI